MFEAGFVVCVVFGVLLSKERKVKNIHNMQLLHLVDDVDKFLNYPWGRVSFQYLLENVESGYRNMKVLLPKAKRTQFDLNGFVYAIQAWAYEVFPNVANFCAAPIDKHKIGLPRVVRWSSSSSPQFMALTKFFQLGPDFKFLPMELSDEEHEAVEAAGIPLSKPEPEPPLEPLLHPKKSKGKRKIHEENEDENNVSRKRCYMQPKHENLGEPSDKESSVTMSEILERLKRNEQLLLGLYAHFNVSIPVPKQSTESGKGSEHVSADSKGVEFSACDLERHPSPEIGKGLHHPSASPKGPELASPDLKHHHVIESCKGLEHPDTDPKGCESKAVLANLEDDVTNELLVEHTLEGEQRPSGDPEKEAVAKTLVDMSSSQHKPLASREKNVKSTVVFERKRQRKPSHFKNSSWIDLNTKPNKYNPIQLQNNLVIEEFKAWHSKARKPNVIDELQLPLKYMDCVNGSWFNLIVSNRGWLTNVHLDVMLNMFMYKVNMHPDRFQSQWTLMDSFGTLKLLDANFESDESRLMNYASGSWPSERGKPWYEVDYIYGIANILGIHWVAYVINLEAQSISVYDSLSMKWPTVSAELNHMRRSVPWVCRKADVWARKGWATELKDEWELIQVQRPPKQTNGNDCGIMSLKFIECFISGNPVDIIVPKDSPKYRQSFCADLFKLCVSTKAV